MSPGTDLVRSPGLVSVVIPTYKRAEKLKRCINSVLESDYTPLEVIVVDDSPTDDIPPSVNDLFPSIQIVKSGGDQLVSRCRNIGMELAKGDYVFFLDDDNVLSKDTISYLVGVLDSNDGVGVAGPIMYYLEKPATIWCAGIRRNSIACVSSFVLNGQSPNGKLPLLMKTEDLPNAFMVRKDVLAKCGPFDSSTFPIHYEEADFCYRVRSRGYEVSVVTSAKTWHDIPLERRLSSTLRPFSRTNASTRLYFTARNKIIFHRKWYGLARNMLFLIFFMPGLFAMECTKALSSPPNRKENLVALVTGTLDGIKGSSRLRLQEP